MRTSCTVASRSWLSTSLRGAPDLLHTGARFVVSGEVSQKKRHSGCISFFGDGEGSKKNELSLVFSLCTLKKIEKIQISQNKKIKLTCNLKTRE